MRYFLGGCPLSFTSPVEPVRNDPSSFAYSRSLSHLVRFGTSAQSFQICSLVAVVSLFTSMTATLVVVPTIAPDTATVTSMTTATIPVLDVLFFTRWLSLCSPSSSRNPKGVVPNTESIRVFAKGVGLLLAIQDNVRDCCERCYLKVARPMITIPLSTEVLTKE